LIRGHFTRALLCGLWGDSAEPTGGITASKLKARLEALTPTIANEHKQIQRCEVANGFDGDPLFGSALPRETGVVEIRFRPARTGKITLTGPGAKLVKEDDSTTGPWRLTLSRGMHDLREAGTGLSKSFYFYPLNEINYVEF
jgi:hypothetical protein